MNSHSLDKVAMSLSTVCLLHCLLAPVTLTLLPIAGSALVVPDEIFHRALLWVILPTSIIALTIGCKNHRDWRILGTGAVGMIILSAAAFAGHDWFGVTGEKWVTSAGGLILAYSHFLNYRTCRSLTCDSSNPEHANCQTEHHH